jgi:hypothetical protein
MLQVSGQSATTLQVAYDSAPNSASTAATVRRPNLKRLRAPAATPMFRELQK